MTQMQRALEVAALSGLICAGLNATSAFAHDCRVRDVAGYLRGTYEGECDKSEIAHGQGEAKGADTYVGTFVDGWPEGKGKYTWENGARYEGLFRKGRANGAGLYTTAKGVRYEGEFVAGKLAGMKREDCPVTQGPIACDK